MYLATTDSFATGSKTALTIDHSGIITTNRNYLQATGSLRAPIFYDSDTTAYYVDPNSTSNLLSATFNGSVLSKGFSSGDNWMPYSDGNFYIRAPIMYVDGSLRGASDVRGTIFYDSNNTSYYVDPNSQSYLNAVDLVGVLTTSNGIGARADGTSNDPYGFVSVTRSSAANYAYFGMTRAGQIGMGFGIDTSNQIWFGGTNAGYNATRTSTWFYFNTGGDVFAPTSSRAPIFYDLNNTAYYVDPAASTALNINGGITFATSNPYISAPSYFVAPGGAYFNSGTVYMEANLKARGGIGNDSGAALTLTGGTSGYTQINGSARSPIFYDSDNTGYYLDPASTSELNKVYYNSNMVSRNYGIGQVGLYSSVRFQAVFSMGESYLLAADGTSVGNLYGIAWSYPSAGGAASNLASHGMLILENGSFKGAWGGGSLRTTSDIRGTIFYDWDNTAFYVDPAGTSVLNVLSDPALSDSKLYLRTRGDTNHYLWNAGDDWEELIMYFGTGFRVANSAGGGTALTCFGSSNGNYTQAAGSLRAPIFYDSADTTYYVNPNDYSVLYGLSTYYIKNNYDVSVDHPFGVYFATGLSTAYAIYREPGAWNYPYPDLRIAFHTGIKIGANASYQGVRFYTDYDMSSQVMSVNNASDALGGGNVYVNSALQAGSSLRAPIFYDSDNTGYYLDPTSITALRTVGSWRADSASWDGDFSGKIQYHSSHWYFQYGSLAIFRNAGGSNVVQIDQSGNLTANGNVTAYSDRRLKDNIRDLTEAKTYLDKISAKRFTWKDDGCEDIGFIAQDVEEAGLTEFVLETEDYDPNTGTMSDPFKTLDYGRMVSVLWQVVKELNVEVETLKSKVH